jgi:hypothetical protein
MVAGLAVLAPSSAAGAGSQRDRPAATPPPATATASIEGRVVILVTGQPAPVRRARVTLDSSALAAAEVTDADTEGRFRFDNLPGGTYRITVDKPGFVLPARRADGALAAIDVKPGQAVTTIVPMLRGAALEGRLVRDNGEPAPNIVVSAVRLAYGAYGRQPVAVRPARTDDLGRFRVHSLPAGEYYIEAALDGVEVLRAAETPGERPQGAARTYYPGTARFDEARIIPVTAGQDVPGLDFVLHTVPIAALTGRVVASSGKAPAAFGIRIQHLGAPPGGVRGTSPPGSNTFRFPAVPPGEYWLLACALPADGAELEFAATRIEAAGQVLPEITMTTARGAVVNGRVEVDGEPPLALDSLRVVAHETEFEIPDLLNPAPTSAPARPGVVHADGTVAFPSLFGRRLFRFDRLPPGWAIKDISLDGTDISDTPVDFRGGDRPHVLRIVVTNRTAGVGGTVERPRGAEGSARVIVFAEDARYRGRRSRMTAVVDVGDDGRYAIAGLLPGRYFIAAVEDLDDGSWEDADVLARLQSIAAPLAVREGQRLTVNQKLRDMR